MRCKIADQSYIDGFKKEVFALNKAKLLFYFLFLKPIRFLSRFIIVQAMRKGGEQKGDERNRVSNDYKTV